MRATKEDLRELGLIHGAAVALVFAFILAAALSEFVAA